MNLDEFFGGKQEAQQARLGMVVSGSLSKGLEVKLDGPIPVEEMKVGRYMVIEGERHRFFSMVTDISLGVLDQRLTTAPPDLADPFTAEVLAGTSTFGMLHLVPMLTLEKSAAGLASGPQPVKTVPPHFAPVREAREEDVARVFGAEDASHFYVGTPLDMETRVCLHLPRFVERSNGVFGKSGTGKTFLTRLLLIGILQKSAAVNLVFDMHNEYGWAGRSEEGREVKGLKPLSPAGVAVFTLDEASSRRRGVSTDHVVQIGYDRLEPEDIEALREPLNLTERGVDAIHTLAHRLGDRKWLGAFLEMGAEEREALAKDLDIHLETMRALRLSLGRLQRLDFLAPRAQEDSVQRIIDYLERGKHVILEFGRYDNVLVYTLVANVLTRRIHDRWVQRMEAATSTAEQPPQLVITIEEAHKFLNPQVAHLTAFGAIAREMRKYNVTLLIVDQRPSGIDEEVMSQLGTRVTCLLDNERDVDSVLTGVSGKAELRGVLAKLESKQQALIFGHAVPMPVVIQTREYGSVESYRELGYLEPEEARARAQQDLRDLYGD
jgi:hypothetical protein